MKGWFEEYECGCVSEIVSRKADLCGYCPKHGNNSRNVFKYPLTARAVVRRYGFKPPSPAAKENAVLEEIGL